MLMESGLEAEPRSNMSTQEDDTLTPSNKSQADSLSGSTSGLERSESGFSLASKLRRSSSSGHFTARSPMLSPPSEGHPGSVDSQILEQDSWDSRVSETETWIPGPGQSNNQIKNLFSQLRCSYPGRAKNSTVFPDLGEREGVQFSEPQKADFHISFSRQISQQSTSDSSQLKCPVYIYNCSLEHLKEQLVHPNSSRQPRDIFFRYRGHLQASNDFVSLFNWDLFCNVCFLSGITRYSLNQLFAGNTVASLTTSQTGHQETMKNVHFGLVTPKSLL